MYKQLLGLLIVFNFLHAADLQTCRYKVSVTHVGNASQSLKIEISKAAANGTQTCSFVADFAHHVCQHEQNMFAPFTIAHGAAFSDDENNCFLWNIPDFGLIKLQPDGTMFFGHDADSAPLLHDEITLKVPGKLFVQHLHADTLRVKSPEVVHLCDPIVVRMLCVDNYVENYVCLQVHELIGKGEFVNKALVKFDGTQNNPARIGIHVFCNAGRKTCLAQPMVQASYLNIASDNNRFENSQGAECEVAELLTVDKPTWAAAFISNLGSLKIRNGDVVPRRLLNFGFIQAGQLTVGLLQNQEDGQVKILDRLDILCSLINKGEIKTPQLYFSPTQKLFTPAGILTNEKDASIEICERWIVNNATIQNNGKLHMRGDIECNAAQINNNGTLKCVSGALNCANTQFTNRGEWLFERIKTVHPITMLNDDLLELADSSIHFEQLTNNKDLTLHGGNYIVNAFKNNKLQLLDDNWVITDGCAPQALPGGSQLTLAKLPESAALAHSDLGTIECEQDIFYDLKPMPNNLNAQGNITYADRFSRDISQLKQIATPGKVSVKCKGANVAEGDLEFANIGHLELFVDGPFTKYGSLKAPTLSLFVQGPFAAGKDYGNANLAIIAATHGPLTVQAESIDGRFTKFYGKGKTLLETTRGDIALGAPERGIDEGIKQAFITAALNSPCRNYWGLTQYLPSFDHSLNLRNGAYVASDDVLRIHAATNIFLSYGTLFSSVGTYLQAPAEVKNIAGKIYSYGPITIESDLYTHWRDGLRFVSNFPCAFSYGSNYPGSIAAELESLKDINFKTKKVCNLASSIRAAKSIIINNIIIDDPKDITPVTGYSEQPQSYGFPHQYGFCIPQACILQAGQTIQMNLGNFVITSNMNAPGVFMFARTGLFANSKIARDTQDVTYPRIVDVTRFMQGQAQQPGIYQLGVDGAVRTEFPLGLPSTPQERDQVLLENPQHATPLNWKTIFNPLSSINLDLHLQQLLSQVAGKVYAGKAKGNALSRVLWANANKWRQQHGKDVMSQAELQQVNMSMLLAQASHNGMSEQQQTLLCIAPQDICPYQDQGDIVADEFVCVTEGDQKHENNRIVAHGPGGITLESTDGNIVLETQSYTTQSHYLDGSSVTQQHAYPQQQLIAQVGSVNVTAHDNVCRTGTLIAAAGQVNERAQTGSVIKKPLVLQTLVETRSEEDDGWFSTKTTISTHLSHNVSPTTTVAGTILHDRAASSIHAVAQQDVAGQEIVYESPNTIIQGLILADRQTTKTEISGLFSDESHYQSKETPHKTAAMIQAPLVRFIGDAARINASISARELHDQTTQGAQFVAEVKQMLYENQTLIDSPLMSVDAGCKGGYEVMIQPMLMVERIIRDPRVGTMLFESAIIDKNRTQIIGAFVETTYHLKQWQKSWCHVSQVVSDEIIVVAAIAVALITQGMGVEMLAPMLESITAVTGMELSAAGIAMVNAGVSAVCSGATSSFLKTGDPLQTIEHMVSPDQLKSIAISMASAGLCSQLGDMLEINMQQEIKPLVDHVQEHALRSTVDALLNIAINDAPVDRTLGDACMQIPLKAVAGYVSNKISSSCMNVVARKGARALVGGVSGFARDQSKHGFVSGAVGAFTADTIGDLLLSDAQEIAETAHATLKEEGKPLTSDHIQQAIAKEIRYRRNVAKIVVAGVTALVKRNPTIAAAVADVTIDCDVALRAQFYATHALCDMLAVTSQALATVNNVMNCNANAQEPAEVVHQQKAVVKKERAVTQNNQSTDCKESDAIYELMLRLMEQKPTKTYENVIFECAQEMQVSKKDEQPKRRPLLDRIVNPEMSPLIKETSKIIRIAFIDALNKTIDDYAFIPNPVGLACFATSSGRDMYQGRTTVGELAFNTALGIGVLKGVQYTGRGIKVLYQKGRGMVQDVTDYVANRLHRRVPFVEDSLVGKSSNTMVLEADSVLHKLHQEGHAAERRIPFVEDPLAGKWSSATISGDVVLGSDAFNIAYERCTRPTWKIDPAAPFNVVGHGTPSIMVVNTQMHPKALSQANLRILQEKGEVLLNAVQVARVIRTAPGYKKGQHINLFSCETGARPDGIAQKLSTRMKVPVSAFTEEVHVFNDKPLFVIYSKVAQKVGVVKTFYPKSGVSKAVASSILLSGCDENSSSSSSRTGNKPIASTKPIVDYVNVDPVDTHHDLIKEYEQGKRKPFVQNPKQGMWFDACTSGDLILDGRKDHIYYSLRSEWKKDKKCPFNVLAHGTPFSVIVDKQGIHPKGLSKENKNILKVKGKLFLKTRELKRLIETAPGYKKGQHINLFSCNCGVEEEGIAQQLANEMQVPVSAFAGTVSSWQSSKTGRVWFTAEDSKYGLDPKELKTFYPRKKEQQHISQ